MTIDGVLVEMAVVLAIVVGISARLIWRALRVPNQEVITARARSESIPGMAATAKHGRMMGRHALSSYLSGVGHTGANVRTPSGVWRLRPAKMEEFGARAANDLISIGHAKETDRARMIDIYVDQMLDPVARIQVVP